MMKKVLKRMAAIALIGILSVSTLAGCGAKEDNQSSNTGNEDVNDEQVVNYDQDVKDEQEVSDVKDVKIGVILYNYTDIQGKEIKNYCEYLTQNFPVQFEYQTATANDNDAHLAAVDSLISTGCNGIISGYDSVVGASMEKCEEAGVYYGILLGEAKSEANKDGNYNEYGNWGTVDQSDLYYSDYFLGGIYQFGADHGLELGKTYGQAVVDSGAKKVGAISFPTWAFSDSITICEGFQEVLKAAGVEICESANGGLPEEADFVSVGDDTKAYIEKYKDMDCIFGLSSGMDMVLPAVNEVGRLGTSADRENGKMTIASLGYNESSRKYLEDGSLTIGGVNNYVQSVSYMFTLIFDAVNENNWKTNNEAKFEMNVAINYPTFTNVEELEDFETYMLTTVNNEFENSSVTADELKKVMKSYEGTQNWSDLQSLVSRSIAEIKEIRQ